MADPSQIKEAIRRRALAEGFDAVGFASAEALAIDKANLARFLAEGRHADMAWMAETADRRADPQVLWPEARTVVVLGLSYAPADDPRSGHAERTTAALSVYARNKDYHDVVKKALKRLGRWMAEEFDCDVKVFVDTAPVMESALAARSGIGWQGRHTNLVSREFGSYLLLGEVFTTLDLPADPPEPNRCGSCAACVAACPTGALDGEGRIDARRCLSYLTIENKEAIPEDFRPAMGNRVYGCDDCTAACPWNKFAPATTRDELKARPELDAPPLGALLRLDDAAFRALFTASPIKRIGRDRFLRNVLIAVGNSADSSLVEAARAHLDNPAPLVREAAQWAVRRLTLSRR